MQAALAYNIALASTPIPLHPLRLYCTMQTAPLGGNLLQEKIGKHEST